MPRPPAALLALLALVIGVLAAGQPTSAGTPSSPGYTLELLPTLGGNSCRANDLNDEGQVCGEARDAANRRRACLWTEGTPLDLGVLPGHLSSSARGINDYGQVCGESLPTSTTRVGCLWTPDSPNGQSGSLLNLGTLGGAQSFAAAVNSDGLVCGWADDASNRRHAVCWTPSAPNSTTLTIHDLGILPGASSSQAWDINDNGMICGTSSASSGQQALLLWQPLTGFFQSMEPWTWQVANRGAPPGAVAVTPQAIDTSGTILGNAAKESQSGEFTSFSFTIPLSSRRYTVILGPSPANTNLSLLDRHPEGINVGTVMTGSDSTAVVQVDGSSAVKPLPVTSGPAVASVNSATGIAPEGTIAANVTDASGNARAATLTPDTIVLTKEAFRDGKPLTKPLVSGDRVTFVITATNTLPIGIPRLALVDRPLIERLGELADADLSLESATTSRPAQTYVSPGGVLADFGSVPAGQSVQLTVTGRYTQPTNPSGTTANAALALTSTLPGERTDILLARVQVEVDTAVVRDATSQVDTQASPVVRNKSKVVITNTPSSSLLARPKGSDGDLPGPLYLILDNLQNATLLKATGVTTRLGTLGSPYIRLKAKSLPVGKKLTAALSFQPGPGTGPITFTTRLAVGPEAP